MSDFRNFVRHLSPMRVWRLAGMGILLAMVGTVIGWAIASSAQGDFGKSVFGGSGSEALDQIARLTARVDALERRAHAQQAAMYGGRQQALSPEQLQARQKSLEHQKHMQENPAYALQIEKDRLADLQARFAKEPMNHRWATEAGTFVNEALTSAVANSGIPVEGTKVDCRSSSCLISFEMNNSQSYEDLLLYLSTDMAEILPRSQLVILPPVNGVRMVNILATGRDKNAAPKKD